MSLLLRSKKVLFLVVMLLFILSGVAALMYQVVWFKYLSYFLGNTTYAQAIVLATFMGGLAIGAWWWGKKADESKNALKLFAWLEILIAVYCFLYFPIFEMVKNGFVYVVISNSWDSDSGIVLFLKLIVSALTILIPTILMGGTLPVLVRYLSDRIEEVGKNVAILYFINSFGAIIGTVIAGFYLLEYIGLKGTVYVGALADLFVGLIFLVVAYYVPKISNPIETELNKTTQLPRKEVKVKDTRNLFNVTPLQFKIVLIIAGVSGMCAMIYEVMWLRLLIPILSSSTYSFTLILTAFITGITIGSLIVYFLLPKIKNPYVFLGFCQLGIVLSILLTIPYYEKIPYLIWNNINGNEVIGTDYTAYLLKQFYYTFILLVLPTIFMGMSLPTASKIAVKKVTESGESVGRIFSINTVGTVVGSVLAGLFMIPFLGIKLTLEITVFLNIILVFLVLLTSQSIRLKIKLVTALSIVLCLGYYYISVKQENWVYAIMTSVVPRKINQMTPPKDYFTFLENEKSVHDEILFYKEGVGGTVVVSRKGDEIQLYTNGKGDAGSQRDLRTQVSLAQTPMVLHPRPDSVFVIGFGAGTTIGNVMSHSRVKYAQVAEISPEVIEASEFFNHVNQEPLKDKRLKLIKDDGVSALRLSPNKYDVIISQPSNPWSAGVGNLFTDEFFRDCKAKLRYGGYVAQWFSLYEMSDKTLKMVIRTVLNQFEYVSLWHIGTSDVLLLCSSTPFKFDMKDIEKNYGEVKHILDKVNLNTLTTFLSQQMLSTDNIDKLKAYAYDMGTDINTENRPILESWAPENYFLHNRPDDFLKLDERNEYDKSALLLRNYEKSKGAFDYDNISKIAAFHIFEGNRELALTLADREPLIYLAWAKSEIDNENYNDALFYLNRLAKTSDTIRGLYEELARMKSKQNDHKAALIYLTEGIKKNPNNSELYLTRGTTNLMLNQIPEAISDFEKSLVLNPKEVKAYINLATVRAKMNQPKEAIKMLNAAELLSKDDSKLYYNRGSAKGIVGDYKGSVEDFTKTVELDSLNGRAYFLRGKGNQQLGETEDACKDYVRAYKLGVKEAQVLINELCK